MSVQVSLWSNSTIYLTDLPPFKMVSVSENRNVMAWAYIIYSLPRNGWHLNCMIIWRPVVHIFTYDMYSYCYLVIYKERCDPNLVVITDAWFLIQLFFKWNSSEVWRLYVVIWNFYNNVRIKNIFLGQKFLSFMCQYPIKKISSSV
jgi:hypothetical protein